MPNIYIISDTHLNHKNIIKYCDRPYATVDEMNSDIIAKWNSTVSPDDTVYFLGDFCLGPHETFIRFSNCLNGHKHFLLGNHDHISVNKILAVGWESCKFEIDIEYNGQKIHLQHYPTSKIPDDTVLIYGHVHNNPVDPAYLPHKSYCACVELHDYKPVLLDDALNNLTLT